jgi:phosphonate transport system substrate-binding protein
LTAIALTAATVASANDIKELNFGIIATEKAGAMKQMWEPFLEDMTKATGIKINGFYATDYAGVIEAQRFNKVQLAWYGNKAAIDAVDRSQGEVFAQFVDLDGTPGYYSYLITHKDSAIKTLDQVLKNGKDFTFGIGDPSSTSGTLVPTYYVFTMNKLDPKTHFKVMRSSNHEGNFLAVLNKQVDLATSNSEMTEKIREKSPEKLEQIRILWTSPLIPRDPLVWRKDLPADVKKKVKDFVTGYGKTDREKEILKNMYRLAGFKASTDAQLTPIRQLELFKDRMKFESDANMNASEKQAKLADIDAKLAALAKAK